MTTDEELNLLDSQLRRLKIDYEIFFSNPTKRPPTDVEWKVLALLRKFSDGGRMNFSQRFRYNEMAQRYAIYSDLWRKKSRIREEGYRRPQDALLSVQGVRAVEEEKEQPVYELPDEEESSQNKEGVVSQEQSAQEKAAHEKTVPERTRAAAAAARDAAAPFTFRSGAGEREQVEQLYKTLVEAKKKAGENVSGNLDSFAKFVQNKTEQIRKQYGCQNVEYAVELADGQVKLKAKAKM